MINYLKDDERIVHDSILDLPLNDDVRELLKRLSYQQRCKLDAYIQDYIDADDDGDFESWICAVELCDWIDDLIDLGIYNQIEIEYSGALDQNKDCKITVKRYDNHDYYLDCYREESEYLLDDDYIMSFNDALKLCEKYVYDNQFKRYCSVVELEISNITAEDLEMIEN